MGKMVYLNDERRSTEHDLLRQLMKRTILNGHDLEFSAKAELKRESSETRVVVQVEVLEVLQLSDLVRYGCEVVLAHVQVLQVG